MYSVPMAIIDFVPTFLFLFAALCIFNYVKNKIKALPAFIYLVGAAMVFAASFLKASYKLICALGKADIKWMTNQFFPNQSLGFLFCGIGMLIAAFCTKKTNKTYAFLPTMALVGIMVAGVAMTNFSLCAIAAKKGKKKAVPFFILAFVFCLCMGYLSSKDFTQSYMNWAAELVNTLGQLFLFIGAKKLTKKD